MEENNNKNNEAAENEGKSKKESSLDLAHIPTERNIKRYSNIIFPPPRAKKLKEERVFKVGNGAITIIPSVKYKAPTLASYRVFLALIFIAKSKNCEANEIPFTLREIARVFDVSMTGKFADSLLSELKSLRYTTIALESAFEYQTDEGETVKRGDYKDLNILTELKYTKLEKRDKKSKSEIFEASGVAEINKALWANIKKGLISFSNLDVLLKFDSPIAEAFYLRIDNILCSKDHNGKEIVFTSRKIVDDLQLSDVKEYNKLSQRKRRIVDVIVNKCHGKRLSNGEVLQVRSDLTVDGTDWKVISSVKERKIKSLPLPVSNTDPDLVEYLANQITESTGQPEHRRWHMMVATHFTRDHIMQALSELKQEPPENMKNKGAVFTAKLKAIVTRAGLPWIKAKKQKAT
jgi:hypothetical protein